MKTGILLALLAMAISGCARQMAVTATKPATFPTTPAATRATPKKIADPIQRLIADIYSRQKDGNWEVARDPAHPDAQKDQEGALTALAVYALLTAGERPDDPRIHSALQYLEQSQGQGIHAVALRAQAFVLTKNYENEWKAANEALQRDALLLQNADLSCGQDGVLGVWACAQGGVEIPIKYWKSADAAWRDTQSPDGYWFIPPPGKSGQPAPPPPPDKPSFNITCDGLATLFITGEYLHGMDYIDCKGNITDPQIDVGLWWVANKYADLCNNNALSYSALYGIQRIGIASGYKYFLTLDWYRDGADFLIANPPKELSDVCVALLFLARGRAPVIMNKLQYDINMHGPVPRAGNWNERPRDVANFAKWAGNQTEMFLNWQIVNLSVPSTNLHDAPILYIAGNQEIDFTDEEINKLREYVEDGGLIYCNADCASTIFTTAVKKVCVKLFPAYQFRTLPSDSPIYTSEQFPSKSWRNRPNVESLSNGVRELVIIVPSADAARYWQIQTYGGHEDVFQFAQDVFLYAVDRGNGGGLRYKGDTYIVLLDPGIEATQTVKVARLQYAGNWDPEPSSWRRFAAIMHNKDKVDLDVQSVQLGEGKLDNTFKVAHLTGPYKFALAPAARDEIKNYVMGGGTLIVDSCGGNSEFADSAQNELTAIFPNNKLPQTPLPLTSSVFSGQPKLDRVNYRAFARKIIGNLHAPRIRAIDINGRPAVFFSAEDMSVGMVGMQIDGIYGYDPASATALMEKLVLFAANKQN